MKRQRHATVREYTVKQLAALAGVSVRTLHHYDAITLLRPAYMGANGYRYYGQKELLRLQEILVLRELNMDLSEIARTLDAGEHKRIERLVAHRDRFVADIERRNRLVATLDRTIEHLKGKREMTNKQLYEGLSPEQQTHYETWLIERYGYEMTDRIRDAHHEMIPAMAELARIESGLVAAYENGADSRATVLASLLENHRNWVAAQWNHPCDATAYAGLADLYQSHPDFVARYEALAPGFSAFLVDAMKAHADEISGAT